MSAFAAQLAVNLEPVYAIALAIVLLGEQHELSAKFYAVVAIILGAVLAYPLFGPRRRIEHHEVLSTAESNIIEQRLPASDPPCDLTALPANHVSSPPHHPRQQEQTYKPAQPLHRHPPNP